MRNRSFLTLVSVLVLGALTLMAADVTGKWAAEVQGRNGQTRNVSFAFKQDGSTLTGTMVGPMGREVAITNGKVDGDNLSFDVNMEFQGKTYCFGSKEAMTQFMADPTGNLAKAQTYYHLVELRDDAIEALRRMR